MKKNIKDIGLILGSPTSTEVQLITSEINRRAYLPLLIESSKLLKTYSLDYFPDNQSMCIEINGEIIPTERIKGVYWSKVDNPQISIQQANREFKQLVTQANLDGACMLQLLFAQGNLNWVNSFKSIQFHRLKPQQLTLAKALGANIPASYIGKNAKRIKDFCMKHTKSIMKPVFSGGYTQYANFQHSSLEEIDAWVKAPITLQAYIQGKDIRTYVLGTYVISAQIEKIEHSESNADYRECRNIRVKPFHTPKAIQELAKRIMQAFHLKYTAIDWRLSPEGHYVFLEANPAPMFARAQQDLGVEFDRAVVDLMFA